MFKMGGMRKHFPTTFWTFLIGASSLAAVPLITSGFYSKDAILWYSWSSNLGSPILWIAGAAGALITGLYSFRMVFITFFGETKTQPDKKPGFAIKLPLVVLAILALIGGFVELPETMGHFAPFSAFMHTILPAVPAEHAGTGTELLFQIIAAVISLGGIYVAYLLFLKKPSTGQQIAASGVPALLHRYWFSGWGFDWLYNRLFVWPYYWIARVNRDDVIDFVYTIISWIIQGFHYLFSVTQNGRVRTYAAGIAFGAVVLVAIVVFV
jgi:NADH-quinone oxidoreductase subunit L